MASSIVVHNKVASLSISSEPLEGNLLKSNCEGFRKEANKSKLSSYYLDG
jgi:hypothetical protein